MPPPPTFSVVIPTHNREKIVPHTIRCVLEQTFGDFELLVVDNGSVDDTGKAVSCISDPRLRYFRREDSGSPAAPRNLGIRNARGRYVALLDDDDVWYPGKLEAVHRAFLEDPSADIVCHNENIRRMGRICGMKHYGPAEKASFRSLLFEGNCVSGSATTIRADVLREAGAFREGPEYFEIEDYDLWLRLAFLGRKFSFIEEPLGEFVLHEASGTFFTLHRRYPNHRRLVREHFCRLNPKSWLDYPGFAVLLAKIYYDELKTRSSALLRKDAPWGKAPAGARS